MKPKKSLMRHAGRSVFLTSSLVFCHVAPSALAATGTWANSTVAAGNWSDTTKWVGGIVPGAAGDTANFNLDYGTNNKVVTIDNTSRALGTLNIGDPGATHRIVTIQSSGGASLIFNNLGGGALLAKTTATNNVLDVITAPVTLADNLVINVTDITTPLGALRIDGAISESAGARSITKNGAGVASMYSLTNTYSGGTILNAGELQLGSIATFVGQTNALGSGGLTINGGVISSRNGAKIVPNAVSVGGDFTLASDASNNNIMLSGAVNLGGTTRIVTVGDVQGAVISGEISNGGLTKAGVGTPLTLSGFNTYTGPTTVNAGTLALSGSITSSVTVAAGAVFDETPAGVIGGASSFTTSGTATLGGTNTYTGATTINGGTLTLSGATPIDASSGVSINGGTAKLVVSGFGTVIPPVSLSLGSLDGNGHINSLTVADSAGNTLSAGNGTDTFLETDSMTFQGAATLNVRGSADLSGQYFVTNSLATSSSTDVVVNATNTSGIWSSGVDYTVIQFSSYLSAVDASHFTLGTVSGLLGTQSAALVNTGSAIVLRITSEALVWTGGQSSEWTTTPVGGLRNWSLAGNPVEYSDGNSVSFNDSASRFDVNFTQNVSPGSIVVDNSLNHYTFSSTGNFGILTGSLTKAGTGILTLTTNNTYTGATSIIGGTLEISGGSIASSSSIVNNGELIINQAAADIYANPITGAGSVTKQGSSTLTLSGNNAFTGNFTLDGGRLNLNSPSALGVGPGTIMINGGSLDNTSGGSVISTANKAQSWAVDVDFAGTNSLDMGSGTVTLSGVAANLTTSITANTLTVGEMKSAVQGLVKQGAGTLVVTSTGAGNASSVLGGVLNVAAGTLQINRTNADAAGSGDLTAAGLTGTGTINNGAAVERWLIINTTGSDTFAGTLANGGTGGLGLNKQGIGMLTLTGSSSYTGVTTVGGGILNVQNSGALGGSAVSIRSLAAGLQLQGGITVPNNIITSNDGSGATGYAIANVSGDNTISGSISMTDGAGNTVVLSDTGSLNLAGNVTNIHATSTRTLFLQGASTAANTVSGVISNGTPATLVTKRESGTWTLSGFNTYTGATSVEGGILAITGSLGNTPVAVSGGTLSLQSSSAVSQNTVTLSGTGLLTQTVNGAISGSASLVIQTPAVMSMPNSYTGDTTINAGTSMPLTITNASAAGTGRLNAATGATTPIFNLHIDGGGLITMPNGFGGNSGVATTIDVNNNGSGSNGLIQLNGVAKYGNGTLNVTGGNGYNLSIAGFDNNAGTAGTSVLNPTTANLTLGSYSSSTNFAKTLQLNGTTVGNSVTGSIANGTAGTVALTKANTGTWVLSGTNSYTGATSVNAGTLVINGDSSAATGTVTVAADATLAGNGNLGGAVTINLGGHQAIAVAATPASQVTRTISGVLTLTAGNILDLTAGTTPADGSYTLVTANGGIVGTPTSVNLSGLDGTVSVVGNSLVLTVGGAGGYSSWSATNAPGQTANQDYDNEGVSNGVEYLLGGSAATNDLGKLPVASVSGGNLVFTFIRSQASKTPDVSASIQVGTTLAAWPITYVVGNDTASSSAGVTVTDNGNGTDTIVLTVPQTPDSKKFARLVVTVN